MRKKKKQVITNSIEVKRQTQMMRLFERYSKQIYQPNTWTLPYVYIVYYMEADVLQREEFICHSGNIIFAAILFEAQKLPQHISIVDITICGYESQFDKLINKAS